MATILSEPVKEAYPVKAIDPMGKSTEQILQEAKVNMLNQRLKGTAEHFDASLWARIAPALRDYIEGMSVMECCRKHLRGATARTDFYEYLKSAGLPKFAPMSIDRLMNKYRVKGGRVVLPPHIAACTCPTCKRIVARAKLVNDNKIA